MVLKQSPSELRGMRHTAGVILIAALQQLLPRVEPVQIFADDVSFELHFLLDVPLPEGMLPEVERRMIAIIREKPPIESVETLASNAADYFSNLGQEALAEELRIVGKELIPIVRMGDLMFPCEVPHELDVSLIGAVKLFSITHDAETGLSIICGTVFAERRELRQFIKRSELAKENDHCLLARELELFGTHDDEWFWLPKGATIRNQLLSWWQAATLSRGFSAVSYLSEEDAALTHARIYAATTHAASDLPVRYCELIERKQAGIRPCGLFDTTTYLADALSVFCRSDQVVNELTALLELMKGASLLFGLSCELRLSGKGKWLPELLQSMELSYTEADGTSVQQTTLEVLHEDALGRRWTGMRIAIHHALPTQQRLVFQSADGDPRTPVQITASFFSSIERFTALLIEQFSGRLPLWLAPEQIRIIPISERHIDYCEQVRNTIAQRHLRVETDFLRETLSARVFAAESGRVPYVLVVGDQEEREGCITVRDSRSGTVTHGVSLGEFLEQVQEESGQRRTAHKHKPLRKND